MKSSKPSKLLNNKIISCSFCNSENMSLIIDFGNVALAGGFLRTDQFKNEKKYPLQLYFCNDCYLVQIVNKISPEVLFKNYFYFSSAIVTLRDHFADYAQEVTARFLKPKEATVLEIGCNDGVLLHPFSRLGLKNIIGIDPSVNAVKAILDSRIFIINDFFSKSTAKLIQNKFGLVDLIVANNVYAHIDDIRGTTKLIERLLKADGVFIFEVHYIDNLIKENQYDMIYHEHLYYYSLLTLEKFLLSYNMEIFDVKQIPIHAGSMRYYVRKIGGLKKEAVSDAVIRLRNKELERGYSRVETYLAYADRINIEKHDLMCLLKDLKKSGKVIFGYGASGRANTIIQYCHISDDILDCIIDDASAKHGFYMPGSHFAIKTRDFFKAKPPDYVLLFAWSFLKEIVDKNIDYLHQGGKFIIPLPKVKIISWSNGEIVEKLYEDLA